MIKFIHSVETAEDKILGRRSYAPQLTQEKDKKNNLKRSKRSSFSDTKTQKTTDVLQDVFDRNCIYNVYTKTGRRCLFNGFEISQMLSIAGKNALINGAKTVTDGPYRVEFKKICPIVKQKDKE